MRRTFFHADEFGSEGMVYIPYAACVSDPAVIWAPAARLLLATQQAFLRPKDLLTLVDNADAPVRMIGRENWLCDKAFRDKHPWPGAKWLDEFDGVVKRFALEDSGKPRSRRRVIIAEEENGFIDADARLTQNGQALKRRLNKLFTEKSLPTGILEKATRARERRQAVPRAILRDFYNHSRAMVSAGAHVAITPGQHMALIEGIVLGAASPEVTTSFAQSGGDATPKDVQDAMSVLKYVKPVMSFKHLQRFLNSGLKRDLHELLYSPRSSSRLDEHLITQIKSATAEKPFLNELLNLDEPIDITLSIGGVMLALLMYELTGDLAWTLIAVPFKAARRVLRTPNLIPARMQKGHPARALFYLAYGKERPFRKQVAELVEVLVSSS